MVSDGLRFLARRSVLRIADFAVTMPLARWTWQGLSERSFSEALADFRPSDGETVHEMMQGRYLLAAKLVDTDGVSPFAVDVRHRQWLEHLHAFAWLRHFREARDSGSRRFARTLVLDWIGREGGFDRRTWAPGLCARRVMNWLRHYALITEGATPEQQASIARSLASQIQSLRLRARLVADPAEALLVAVALAAAALCQDGAANEIEPRTKNLLALLNRQIDADGLHLSRNAALQLDLLVELVTLRKALAQQRLPYADAIGAIVETMHLALDALTLGTGEPAYFNGCGQLPHDLVVAVQAESGARQRTSTLVGGYGLLVAGESKVVADGGQVPPPEYAAAATASALGFEFSHGTELVFGSCGPAPAELLESRGLFRQGMAHSAPTIDAVSTALLPERGLLAGRLRPLAGPPSIVIDAADQALVMRTEAYRARFGVSLERRVTLLADGNTLVGQDRFLAGEAAVSGLCTLRFHLAPGAEILDEQAGSLVRFKLGNDQVWTFLWEGAELHEEESVRQSAHFGFHRTRQLALEAPVRVGHEIAWIFTREDR